MTTDRLFTVLLVLWFLAVLGFFMALGPPAHAQTVNMVQLYEDSSPSKTIQVSHVAHKKPVKHKHVAKKTAPKPSPTKVMAYEERPEDGKCYRPLTVVGSQWVGEQGAYDSAVKSMKEAVRWSIGEAAMDPVNWKDIKRRCSLSSVGEIVGQTFHRCELTVVPCRPGLVRGADK